MSARLVSKLLRAASVMALLISCSGMDPEQEGNVPEQDADPVSIRVMAALPFSGDKASVTLVQRTGVSEKPGLYKSSGFIRDVDGQTLAFTVPDVHPESGASSYYYSLLSPSEAVGAVSGYKVFMTIPVEQNPSSGGPDPSAMLYTGFGERHWDAPPALLEFAPVPLCATGVLSLKGFDPDEGESLVSVTLGVPGSDIAGSVSADVFFREADYRSETVVQSLRLLTSGIETDTEGFDLYFCCKPFALEGGEKITLLMETSARTFPAEITLAGACRFSAGGVTRVSGRIEMPVEADPDIPEEMTSYTVTGRQWYISPDGDDRNSGSSRGAAVKSFDKAVGLLSPGDQLRVMPGIYEATSSDLIRLGKDNSGSEGHWISIVADDPEDRPVLHAGGYGVWNALVVNASYVAIEGLVLCGDNQTISLDDAYSCAKAYYDTGVFDSRKIAFYNTNGIAVGGSGQNSEFPHHVIIRDCIVHDFPGGGISAIQADYVTIEYNEVYNNAWYCMYGCSGISFLHPLSVDGNTGYKMIIRGNRVWNNHTDVPWVRRGSAFSYSDGNGIILDINKYAQSNGISPGAGAYTGRTLVENNLSVHNGGSGIHAFKADHVDIVGNTAYDNGWKYPDNSYAEIWNNQSSDVNIYNNIMYARAGGKCNIGSSANYRNNVCYGGPVQYPGTGMISADPEFANLSADRETGDFHLMEDSPAIGAGYVSGGLHCPVGDLEKHSRKGRFDCGAYQYTRHQ